MRKNSENQSVFSVLVFKARALKSIGGGGIINIIILNMNCFGGFKGLMAPDEIYK